MANILEFNGGKFLRADPSIIGTQFATRLINVDIDAVVLRSLKGPSEGTLASSTTETTIGDGVNAVTTVATTIDDSFYRFGAAGGAVGATDAIEAAGGSWISSPDSDYIEYGNKLYSSRGISGSGRPEKYDGNRTNFLGIHKPKGDENTIGLASSDPTEEESSILGIGTEEPDAAPKAATLQYTITYYNRDDGTESAPMPFTKELNNEFEAGKVIVLSNIPISDDPQVSNINIYRLGGELVHPTRVARILNEYEANGPSTTTYRDTRRGKASDIGVSEVLDSIDNIPPDPRLTSLVEAYGIFFGMVDNELRFSEIDNPNYWPPQNSFRLRRNGTGLLVTLQGLLVFTDTDTYLLSGTNSQTFTLTLLSDKQGCTNHKSCQLIKNLPLWISYEGICTLENFSVNVLSKFFLDTEEIPIKQTEVFDEQYYIVREDGYINVLELKDTARFYDIKLENEDGTIKKITGIRRYRDKLYFAINRLLHEAFSDDAPLLKLKYTSPVLTDNNHSVMKHYNKIYIRYNGKFTIDMYIDGEPVVDDMPELDSKGKDATVDYQCPSAYQRGYSCQFKIEGTGTIYSIETLPIPRHQDQENL